MGDDTLRASPTRSDTLDALNAFVWRGHDVTVSGVLAREDDFLVLVRHSRVENEVGVAYLWPDVDLTGESTGEPQTSLDDWVAEIAMDLDEYFATEPLSRLQGHADPQTGHLVIRRYGPEA